jgi:hypothetical protein
MIRATARKALRRLGIRRGPQQPWVLAADAPSQPRLLADVPLFAIVGTWMEEDVVAATVANALLQGCERVYLVDNASSDATVAEAVAAGAQLAETFETERYDERLRLDIMNEVVRRESAASGHDHVWWLWLDADEFPHGPRGLTLAEYLRSLDRGFRIVGARFINHFPDREPAYVPGFHPLDFQPLGEEHALGCLQHHRKHPLQRWDRGGAEIICDRGFHRASSAERPLYEPREPIFLHHFPYRDPAVTRARLSLLCGTNDDGDSRVRDDDDAADGMIPRFQTLDAVYRGDWDAVRNYRPDTSFSVARPVPWTSIVGDADAEFARWYSSSELEQAKESYRAGAQPDVSL